MARSKMPRLSWNISCRKRTNFVASSKSVIAVLDDLMFTVKINEAAKKAGVAVQFLKSEKDVLDKAREHPALVILDLNFAGVDPFSLVEKLKADGETKSVPLIGYVSHVQGELKLKA